MTGLLILAVVSFWAAICRWLTKGIVRRAFAEHPQRRAIEAALFVMLLSLIVIDEITALPVFYSVCRSEARFVAVGDLQGKSVWLEQLRSEERSFGLLRGVVQQRLYADAKTGAPAFHYGIVYARGGILIRSLGISPTQSPLLFDSSCVPAEFHDFDIWLRKHQAKEVMRPISSDESKGEK